MSLKTFVLLDIKLEHVIYFSGGLGIELHQTFRVSPKVVDAKLGDNIMLVCEVDNLVGTVQWSKDGMALGKLSLFFIFYWYQ